MQKFLSICTITFVFSILAACSQKPASVEFKGYTFYGKNYYEYHDSGNQMVKIRDIEEKEVSDASTKETTIAEKEPIKEQIVATEEVKTEEVVEKKTICKPIEGKSGKTIKVTYGDTLYGLAIKHDIPVQKLIELNNLQEPYGLRSGQELRTSKTTSATNHIVKSGENLSTIAQSYNTKLSEIAKLNEIEKPYVLHVGQKLKLPSAYKCETVEVKKQVPVKVADNTPKTPIENSPPLFKKNSFLWPVKGQIISKFGPKQGNLYNDGINISAAKATPFKAAEDGVVAYVGNELKGYGNLVIIKHSNNWISAYAHADEIAVKRGAPVKKGDVIGTVGQTGNVSEPQLYFGLRKGRKALDPERYLK